MRYAKAGLGLEVEVGKYLTELQFLKQIVRFEHHEANSPEDVDGRDFTVEKEKDGVVVAKSFGVTISLHRWRVSQERHTKHAQLCFPLGTNKTTIVKRILGLFDDENGH